jgi:hypothetical protein
VGRKENGKWGGGNRVRTKTILLVKPLSYSFRQQKFAVTLFAVVPAVLAAEKAKIRLVPISIKKKGASARKLKPFVLF